VTPCRATHRRVARHRVTLAGRGAADSRRSPVLGRDRAVPRRRLRWHAAQHRRAAEAAAADE